MKAIPTLVACLVLGGCADGPADEWIDMGARDGDPLTLGSSAERRFRARLCRQAPVEVDLDITLAAVADDPGPAELTVAVMAPEQEREQTFTIEGRTRVEVGGFDSVDPDASCELGIPVVFRASTLAEPMTIEWALHFEFRADQELRGTTVELFEEP